MDPSEALMSATFHATRMNTRQAMNDPERWYGMLDVEMSLRWLVLAAMARRHAQSYRGFAVGVAAVGVRFENCFELYGIHGTNVKPQEDAGPVNVHAEQMMLLMARQLKLDTLDTIALVGDLQPDTQSGKLQPTLHPCGICRSDLERSGLVTPQTLIISGAPDLSSVQWYNLDGLSRYHESGDKSGIQTVNDLPPLEDMKHVGETEFDIAWEEQVLPGLVKRRFEMIYETKRLADET